MKNIFSKKSASSGNEEQAPPDVKKGKTKEKKKKKSSDGEKTQKVKKKKEKKKKSDETKPKKERAPPPRIAAAEEAVPSDDDPTTPGVGGNLTPDQLSVFRRLYKVRTPGQVEKVKEAFTEEEIARIKEKFEHPSVSKMLKKKDDSANPMTGFAKYSGGPQAFKGLDPSKWRLQKFRFSGKAKCEVTGDLQEVHAPVREGLVHFLTSPIKYIAMMFQSNMTDFDPEKQKFTLLHRLGTYQYRPQDTTDLGDRNAEGIFTLLVWTYEHLPPFPYDELPLKARDQWTDHMTYQGQKLGKPIMPGRGMAIGDAPNLCVIDDVDPTDVYQGTVGDCWLLGAISSLAEFDGAVKRMFRKTKLLDKRPLPGPNMYTITLTDLETWKPVSYQIDERLPVKGDGSGKLLGCRLSGFGELWPALLEKALAIHCGGWDAIYGGCCSHAWAIMTGCKDQYCIERNPKTGKWFALKKYNPHKKKWEKHYNNPKDDPGHNLWKNDWPEVGGGGGGEITDDDLFRRICKWDEADFIMSAATTGSGGSSVGQDAGLVDDHAYSLIEAYDNVAGTGVGLLNVRNPWGTGEIEDGEFDDDGPGWEKYPEIKEALNPVFQDDGAFWVTKEEFFRFYQTIYLSAKSMTEFLED
mmetsp:Transcript_1503/g.3486  ORF Transcript_1503/g.3486 Transcript_1503/m.3486 type:complete len:634 (-) Transcript_1503:68-1969(-)